MYMIVVSQVAAMVEVFLLCILWEWAVMKRVITDPVRSKLYSVFAAYLTASIATAFLLASIEAEPAYLPLPVAFLSALIGHLLPTIVLGLVGYSGGRKLREERSLTPAEVKSTFE